MTGKEVYEMILSLNAEAKAQGGKLTDLALPEELFDELLIFRKIGTWEGVKPSAIYIDGVRIHTGDHD
jgi:hypothetical protein